MIVPARERWRVAIGVFLGLFATALIGELWSAWMAAPGSAIAVVAPIGASAVILFALPSSPLARPWAVLGGNTLAAVVGVAVACWVDHPQLAAALAVGGAVAAMFAARCLHPPGGAVALLAVLNHTTDPLFVIAPVLLNSVTLVVMAVLYNTRTGHPYPHRAPPPPLPEVPTLGPRFSAGDLDAALARYNEVVDMDRADLEGLLHDAEGLAWQRSLGRLRCGEVMSPAPVVIGAEDSIALAWQRLHSHAVKALPVVDDGDRVVGIVTMADLARRLTANRDNANDLAAAEQAAVSVAAVMSRRVQVAVDTLRLIELLPLFSEGGHHHLPVIDSRGLLVGMITQSDVIRALHRTIGGSPPEIGSPAVA